MNLTNLRRIVLAADVLALAAAGTAAWFALDAKPLAARDWQKIFPSKAASSSSQAIDEPMAKDRYTSACAYPQGDKPVPIVQAPTEAPKPVDDFLTKYKLNGIFLGSRLDSSFAQLVLAKEANPTAFTVGLGERIPAEIGTMAEHPPLTPWRLNELREATWDAAKKQAYPGAAVFVHIDTMEKKVLEIMAGNPTNILDSKEPPASGPGIGVARTTGPTKDQPFRGQRVQTKSENEVEWIMSEEEVEFLGVHSGDQAGRVSIVESKDASGKPDGFVLKGVPADSRAHDVGFRQDDKIISVNDEKVSSTTDAMAKGKKQYEGGKSVFQLKVLRKGKEMTFTFHAPKKKARGEGGGRGRSGD
jgi:hypothetical protein